MNADLEEIRKAKPFIRSVVALLIFLCKVATSVEGSYQQADEFVKQFKEDVESNS